MYDVIIIGAGVVGGASAYYLSQYNISLAILEADNDVANGTTKANSAIMHAGYDPKPGTLMAKYNVEGAKLAKELCAKLDVPYKVDGSLVLSFSDEETEGLKQLYNQGITNGVEQLSIIDHDKIKEMEPAIADNVKAALLAETSAIINPWEYCLALVETAVKNGAELFLNNKVTDIKKENDVFTVVTDKGEYTSKYIINAAGVYADKVHELIGEKEFTITPTKGQYYLMDKSQGNLTKHTLFQCPDDKGKGVTVTPTVGGNLIVGPDAETIDSVNVSTSAQALGFIKTQSLKSVPSIDFRENIRNFAGVRARSDRGDFIIEESKSVSNFFNLAGMGSPALTSAAAIGKAAKDWVLSKEDFKQKDNFIDTRKRIKFTSLSDEEKNKLIKENPLYGRVICRCETITEGEIVECFNTPIPPCSIDGVKRRVKAGMGRCQGGFCGEKVAMILKERLHLEYNEILQDKEGSNILTDLAKGGY